MEGKRERRGGGEGKEREGGVNHFNDYRYRCLKCTNVDLCQNCFWTQKSLKNHKLTHPTREYCMAVSAV